MSNATGRWFILASRVLQFVHLLMAASSVGTSSSVSSCFRVCLRLSTTPCVAWQCLLQHIYRNSEFLSKSSWRTNEDTYPRLRW